MTQLSRIKLAPKALLQLGIRQLGLYALYQLGIRTGHYRRLLNRKLITLDRLSNARQFDIQPCLSSLPDRVFLLEQIGEEVVHLYNEADEIVNGFVRLFGGQPVPLVLSISDKLEDWTRYENKATLINNQDIKYLWESGRLGWACKLAMAYHLSKDEHYAETYWHTIERFLTSNPPYLGPHWSSAQEVAIRLVALAYTLQVFAQSKYTTSDRLESIAKTIVVHAERIPPTLVYSRSQNNNHLITEALGLYTASALLPDHPLAHRWHTLGWRWLRYAFRTQISTDGTYNQHSTNYHRLMLQAALWMYAVHENSFTNEPFPFEVISLIEASTRWIWKLIDPETGRVPNLGHNDGAYILPLTVCPYHDYRPVVHAATRLFLHTQLTPKGPWDDMTAWLGPKLDQSTREVGIAHLRQIQPMDEINMLPPFVIQNLKNGSWATLRVAVYHSRPAHADQLHLDLWWRGLNLAQDAGTYLYNSAPPWENSLTSTLVHNTVVVDGRETMQRAGRFLYLDWAQARILSYQHSVDGNLESLTAEHNGYRKFGVIHQRQVTALAEGHWEIIDRLYGPPDHPHTACLHWLLPDWSYEIKDSSKDIVNPVCEIRTHSPYGWITLKAGISSPGGFRPTSHPIAMKLIRAGTLLVGNGPVSPITGWTAPTYGDKIPALACIIEITNVLPIEIKSEWFLPNES